MSTRSYKFAEWAAVYLGLTLRGEQAPFDAWDMNGNRVEIKFRDIQATQQCWGYFEYENFDILLGGLFDSKKDEVVKIYMIPVEQVKRVIDLMGYSKQPQGYRVWYNRKTEPYFKPYLVYQRARLKD